MYGQLMGIALLLVVLGPSAVMAQPNACCYYDEQTSSFVCTEAVATQAECERPPPCGLGGVWTPGTACADLDPLCGGGACCTPGDCVRALCASTGSCPPGTSCEELSGGASWSYQAGVPCEPEPCVGACCRPNEQCIVTTQEDCNTLGGDYQGVGSTCDPNPCEGACCYEDPATFGFVCCDPDCKDWSGNPTGLAVDTEAECLAQPSAVPPQWTPDTECADLDPLCGGGACCANFGCVRALCAYMGNCPPGTSCEEISGNPANYYPGFPCDPDPCWAACCIVLNGYIVDCVEDLLEEQCAALGSDNIWKQFKQCDACMGACCTTHSGFLECAVTWEDECIDPPMVGAWHEEETCESPNPCEGACCLGDGSCVLALGLDYCETVLGGSYVGDDTSCEPYPCATGACCFEEADFPDPDWVCIDGLRLDECLAQNGSLHEWTPGVLCDELDPLCGGGACCTPAGCFRALCAYVVDGCPPGTSCEELGGDPALDYVPGVPCDPDPCATGACCWARLVLPYPWRCVDGLRLDECLALLGDQHEWTPGVLCDELDPLCGVGACCTLEGTTLVCNVTLEEDCIDAGGTWHFRETCDSPNPCEGACCLVDESCVLAPGQPDCETLVGGDYQGDGTTCDPDPCLGACCTWEGSIQLCNVTREVDCIDAGGTWHLGETCDSPNPCEGACCKQDGSCVLSPGVPWCEIVETGDYQGDGTTCDPNPCEGACCYYDDVDGWVCCDPGCDPGSQIIQTRRECLDQLGEWTPDTFCSDLDPLCGGGACCTPAGCVQALCAYTGDCPPGTSCEELGGDPSLDYRPGVPCDPDPCHGACCLVQGGVVYDCVPDTTGEECASLGVENLWNQSEDCDACQGACCVQGQPCQFTFEADCMNLGGIFHPGGRCDPDSDPCIGACCWQDPTQVYQCQDCATLQECFAQPGSDHEWMLGINCLQNSGPYDDWLHPPCGGGACCLGGGVCLEAFDLNECLALGGEGYWEGEPCDPDSCYGACCYKDQSGVWQCEDWTALGECDGLAQPGGGLYQWTRGTLCSDLVPPCGFGACCTWDGSFQECIVLAESVCLAQDGVWHSFETCDNPNPCEGACCYDDLCCVLTPGEHVCNLVYQGTYLGKGTDCTMCPFRGDMNVDGFVDGRDVQCFVSCVLGSGGGCDCHGVGMDDVDCFVENLLAGG